MPGTSNVDGIFGVSELTRFASSQAVGYKMRDIKFQNKKRPRTQPITLCNQPYYDMVEITDPSKEQKEALNYQEEEEERERREIRRGKVAKYHELDAFIGTP